VQPFVSGPKRHYYGKGDVIVYRLNRDGQTSSGRSPVFGATVTLLIHGAAFWPTYVSGDNTGLIATDSMKNFIQRETLNFEGGDLEGLCRFLGDAFLRRYPQVEGLQITADEIPYDRLDASAAFVPAGPERAFARFEMNRDGVVDAVSGLRGFKGLRLRGSAFHGFVRDEYTTLPDLHDRPLHMWLDLEWRYRAPEAAMSGGRITGSVRAIVRERFSTFESGSIQQIIHQMGTRVLDSIPDIVEVDLEASNRTWDTVAERGAALGVYTDARPPYGCLGLRVTRGAGGAT
jgi:urate oxidase / 2-oxo-4-hydroxy-4-carboxy-5-ureidoimidazoline decarboxylase